MVGQTVVPTEEVEQRTVVQYCRLKNLPYFRVPSETFTSSWNQKRKNKELGVVRGVPDLFVITNGILIAIEMKRIKGSTTSPQQKEWIQRLNDVGVPAKVCKGADEAIKFIESM